ncbi:F-box/kelch-repeat protein At3g06240-like [Papaver somniferum]|uniref:F-box/kelch-repeat protein At3g06240-like n=1 Tax=Papaver somniferum TaxID=3469 RepID=UPI000E700F21|nr:F-box/kelch-repeat protein At3g06240-like [Papaver somniferum]
MAMATLLPEEIQVDIHLRLPLKSIGICRCVCKLWCSLLCDPSFVKTRLNQTVHTNKNHRLIISHSKYCSDINPTIYSIDYASISASSLSLSLSLELIPSSFKCIASGTIGKDDDNSICIWNPMTGEYKKIESGCDFMVEYDGYNFRYGFGNDNLIGDYKVVRIGKYLGLFDGKVYTLASNSWRRVGSGKHYEFSRERRYPGVLLNGALHWLGCVTTGKEGSSEVIVAFDVSSERSIHLPFPDGIIAPPPELGDDDDLNKDVGGLGDCLCLSVVRFVWIDVWVMQEYGVQESWIKQFTFEYGAWNIPLSSSRYSFCKPIWSFENCEILLDTSEGLLFCFCMIRKLEELEE